MSSLSFLVTELQSLASESRRRFPEVRDAADKVIASLKESQEKVQEQLLQDGAPLETILRPLLLGLGTKNTKVIGIALGSLQRLVASRRIAPSATPAIVNALKDCVNQGVDIQLRILQMLLSLAMNSPNLHGEELSETLFICFRFQESRIAVVSSTAAATLRQLVMFLTGDKVVEEDKISDPHSLIKVVSLSNGTKLSLRPSALDAYHLFEDLCLLINSERAQFLQLDTLSKTFSLELIESILTNCHQLIRKHPEQLNLLGQHLCPFLVKSLTERPAFSSTLRSIRVLFLLLKQFSDELEAETEMFMSMLLKMILGDSEDELSKPYWLRVIAMEIIRGLCKDADFMRRLHERYDSHPSHSPVFSSLVNTLNKVISEKPALLGVSTKIFGIGVGSSTDSSALDVGHFVASAASVTAGMVGMAGQEAGMSILHSSMKVQCIDQLDKVDPPAIPDTYVALLALQSFTALVDGFASLVLPLHHTLLVQKNRDPKDKTIRAPPAFDLSKFPEEVQLLRVNKMLEATWHGFLAALSFILSTRLSDELFSDVLVTYQNLVNVSGAIGRFTARDALLTGLSKFAIPPAVVTALESYTEPATPRTSGVGAIADNLGLSGGATIPPGLSDRNIACLKVLLNCSLYLAGSLGPSWFQVLETLQNAEYVLFNKVTASASRRSSTHGPPSLSFSPTSTSRGILQTVPEGSGTIPVLSDLDSTSMHLQIQRLFEATRNLEDEAFQDFVLALCKLSREMVQMQAISSFTSHTTSASDLLSPATEQTHRRRASGIQMLKASRSGDFGINKLRIVCSLNVHRLIYRSPEIVWTPFTEHLLGIVLSPVAPSDIRVQAARCLDDVIVEVPKNVTSGAAKELQSNVQSRMFDILKRQNDVDVSDNMSAAEIEIRRLCLETLHQILQSSLYSLVTGWNKIFGILSSVCPPSGILSPTSETDSGTPKPRLKHRLSPIHTVGGKGVAGLVRIAFQSVTLICDALTQLDATELQLCISTLGLFGNQGDTNIALTAAASLLWNVSDAIQSRRKGAENPREYDELWMSFLGELLGLCPDPRSEVRDGSIQTLFRSLQLYGKSLSLEIWNRCFFEIIFPLLGSFSLALKPPETGGRDSWDNSKALTFSSIGNVLNEFLVSKLYPLENFSQHWITFIREVESAFKEDNNIVIPASLKSTTRALVAGIADGGSPQTQLLIDEAWSLTIRIGEHLRCRSDNQQSETSSPSASLTQESLLALIELITSLRSRVAEEGEWTTERIATLLSMLKEALSYSHSPEYRPDVDNTTPVQAAIMSVIKSIDVSTIPTARIVVADVAVYMTLAFVAAFDDQPETSDSSRPSKRKVTFVAVSKEVMPILVDILSRTASQKELYEENTIEKAFGAFSIPMKLRYDCPPSSKLNKDPPLWKTATTCFLNILKLFINNLGPLREVLSKDLQASIWYQIAETFSGALLADCSAIESWSQEDRDAEELFDRALLQSLKEDVFPPLGHRTVPDQVIAQLAKVLARASQVAAPALDSFETDIRGTTRDYPVVPREHFAYSCFDLLFELCGQRTSEAEETEDTIGEFKRVSALALLPLITRCRAVLSSFIADEELRGSIPFSRAREEEVLYVLRQMLQLRLWSGCLWVAYSDDPSRYAVDLPRPDVGSTPSILLTDSMKRGPRAHLFQIYPLLCKIISLKHEGPIAWASSPLLTPALSPTRKGGDMKADTSPEKDAPTMSVRLDAKSLSLRCLEELGKEMGLIHG